MTDDQIRELVERIWGSMLDLEVKATEHDGGPDGERNFFTAYVQITGDWAGAVTFDCPAELARRAAAAMFGMEDDEPGSDEIRDALGELANMTGGGYKSMLRGTNNLSLPAVSEGKAYTVRIPGTKIRSRLSFACFDDQFRVSVLAKAE